MDACRKEYMALCGLNFGSTDFMESVVNLTTQVKPEDILYCGKRILFFVHFCSSFRNWNVVHLIIFLFDST